MFIVIMKLVGLQFVVATVFTSKLLKQLNMDQSSYGMLYGGMVEFLDYIINNKDYIYENILTISWQHILFVCLIGYMYKRGFFTYISKRLSTYFKKSYTTHITIYDYEQVKIMAQYMYRFPKYFKKMNAITKGSTNSIETKINNIQNSNNYYYSKWLDLLASTNFPDSDILIEIDDSKFNVKGTIVWFDYDISLFLGTERNNDSKTSVVTFKYFTIGVYTNNINNIKNYLANINEVMVDILCTDIYSQRILPTKTSYDITEKSIGKITDYNFDDAEKRYITSFFHPKRDIIWNYIKKIHLEPSYFNRYGQTAQYNMLLHGPPGTGKSTFAYRIAKALNRHIVNIDLRAIDNKKKLYQIFENPCMGDYHRKTNEVVFILDEFDIAVKYLDAKSKGNNLMEQNYLDRLNTFTSNIDEGMFDTFSSDSDSDSEEETKKKKKKKKKNRFNKSVMSVKKTVSKDISLKDMLEIFQGAVPNEGLIIIATTNHYEEIQKLCPALFRPGRLTPIYFGEPTRDTIVQICQYYFDRKPDFDIPDELHCPTSKIINICLEASMHTNGEYEYFRSELINLVKKNE